jgi:hypothetical protein
MEALGFQLHLQDFVASKINKQAMFKRWPTLRRGTRSKRIKRAYSFYYTSDLSSLLRSFKAVLISISCLHTRDHFSKATCCWGSIPVSLKYQVFWYPSRILTCCHTLPITTPPQKLRQLLQILPINLIKPVFDRTVNIDNAHQLIFYDNWDDYLTLTRAITCDMAWEFLDVGNQSSYPSAPSVFRSQVKEELTALSST